METSDEKRFEIKQRLHKYLKNNESISYDELVSLLSRLHVIEYEKWRGKISAKLKIRTSVLDKEVEKYKEEQLARKSKPRIVEELEPWDEEVKGKQIADEIKEIILKRVVLDDKLATAVVLWIFYTYLFDSFFVSPLLIITSPEKRCGKTRLLTIIGGLVSRALSTSNISPAAIYRAIEEFKPTLIIDEADTFLTNANSEVTGIINGGYTKNNAQVIRNAVHGKDFLPKSFSTWAPKAIAYIDQKRLSGTLEDRSIEISLKRKRIDKTVSKLELDFQSKMLDVRRKLFRWAVGHIEEIDNVKPFIPKPLNDRQADNWSTLLTIGKMLGSEWEELAKQSCLHIVSLADNEEPSLTSQLLMDIKEIFEKKGNPKYLWTEDIIRDLEFYEEHPWAEMYLTPRRLAKMLKSFGINPKQINNGEKNKRGYYLFDFRESFDLYISP